MGEPISFSQFSQSTDSNLHGSLRMTCPSSSNVDLMKYLKEMAWQNPPGSNSAARTTEAPTGPRAEGSYDMRA